MCGLAGVLRFDRDANPVVNDTLIQAGRIMAHRGPDYFGVHWEGPCGLVHNRLSIIDCSNAGRQPMSNESGKVWLAYNGEVYNFIDLKKDYALESKHHFKSRTDTEVIVHLYEELGENFIKHLNGMFAFALWDDDKNTLWLARDPYGIKPLFYTRTKDAFWFASEIKALLEIPGFEPGPDVEALYHYLSFNFIPSSLTAFKNIHELPAGHMLKIDTVKRQPGINRFFDIHYSIDRGLSKKDALGLSVECLERSVKRQLISDVPVGVMLSGGIDSSALVALMAKVRGDSDFHTFSLAFQDASFDESKYAGIVARHIGTKHHEILVTAEKVIGMLPKYLAYIDEPYADGSAIPTYLLAECAKDFVTVLLSGEGGDEFYAGYDTHLAYKIRKLYRLLPSFMRKNMISRMIKMLPVSHKKLSFDFLAKRFTTGAEYDTPESHFSWRVVLNEDAKKAVLDPELDNVFNPTVDYFVSAFNRCDAEDELNKLLYIDFSYHLPDDLMIKNDRMTMANSLEARVPFTDNELVRTLSSIPVKYKLPFNKKKYLLRTAMKAYLPEVITAKKKVGLEMPYSSWLRNELREMSEDVLSPANLKNTGLFNSNTVLSLWSEHQQMKVDHGRFFWGLLNYMLWYDMYLVKRNYRDYLSKPRHPRFQ